LRPSRLAEPVAHFIFLQGAALFALLHSERVAGLTATS
jgi:hypothetical protein